MRGLVIILLVGCGEQRLRERWEGWYDAGSELDVTEPVAFTDAPYDFTGATPIADVPQPGAFETWFAPDDPPTDGCADWLTSDTLPVEITGVVTLHPRQYIKVGGCVPDGDPDVDSDEKYYGSYFLEDASGGFFVLGDSKVAKFEMGDRVTLTVRAVKEAFGLTMISAHDVTEVRRGPEPIHYELVEDRLLGTVDDGRVVRVRGVVGAPMGNFGEIYLCTGDDPDLTLVPFDGERAPDCFVRRTDDAPAYKVAIDVELQRRGFELPVGERVQVTGPVLFSFSHHQVNVIRVGQIQPDVD